jgi:hypothetical protein
VFLFDRQRDKNLVRKFATIFPAQKSLLAWLMLSLDDPVKTYRMMLSTTEAFNATCRASALPDTDTTFPQKTLLVI